MNHRTITSLQNPEIKSVVQLQTSKGRAEQQRFIAEGKRTLETFAHAEWQPLTLYATEAQLAVCAKTFPSLPITLVSEPVMKKMSAAVTPSGILGVFAIPDQPLTDTLQSGIVCANITDPGNVGTLMRTCAAMNKKSVVMIEGVDPWSPKVVQASAGTIALVDIFQLSWEQLVKIKKNIRLTALVVESGKQPHELDLTNTLLVIGSEAHGLSQQKIDQCDQLMTLEMPGKAESLNAAIAGSIALYLTSTIKL